MKKTTIINISIALILSLNLAAGIIIYQKSKRDILQEVISVRTHAEPLRTSGVFAENYSDKASKGELTFNGDSTFNFKYTKSKDQTHAFTGAYFPLENLDINFAKYDEIQIGITTNKARRIPLNLSVQNKKETHQYVRYFIEVNKEQSIYELPLSDFFTPTTWYDRNDISQVEIPKQDLSKVEAMSFESCHLLGPNIEDEFTVHQLILKKNIGGLLALLFISSLLFCGILIVIVLKPFEKETEIVHVPIEPVVEQPSENLTDQIIAFLAKNYTNPNLTLNDLSEEFGKGNAELSKILKEQVKLTFPKYISFLRVEEAKRLLKLGNAKTVSEIGYDVGFNSPSNFIRVFKNLEGISPKKYLEEQESK